MTIALFGSEQVPLLEVTAELEWEGLQAPSFILNRDLHRIHIDDNIEKVVLISPGPGLIDVGEQLERVREIIGPQRRLILCALQPNLPDRMTLMQSGASVIVEPQTWSASHLATRILSQLILDQDIRPSSLGSLRGSTRQMRRLYEDIEKLAPLSESILILGETGTGKELVAAEIHKRSHRPDTYVPINCAEISPDLLSSELFGHQKGAFTGADRDRQGLIATAGEGTVFLDEIGDLDLVSQAKLLRVLEDRKVRRVGANKFEQANARIILATNLNLQDACETGKFRRDLLERMRGFTLELPPLRERKADIPLLVDYFVEKYNAQYQLSLQTTLQGTDFLFRYDWPGNVRELYAVVRKAAAYADASGFISSSILQESVRSREVNASCNFFIPFDPAADSLRDVTKRMQSIYFRTLLAHTNGNRESAIRLSGLSRSQFFHKLKEIG